MNINSRLRNAAATFQYYGRTSTIHGFLQIFQGTSTLRKGFWLTLGVFGFLFGLYHFIITTNRFVDPPVDSQFRPSHEKSRFPYITMCTLKPVSEELFHGTFRRYNLVLLYFNQFWSSFRNWFENDTLEFFSAQNQKTFRTLRRRLGQFYKTFWVSADSRDLGISDTTMVLDCNFNGVKCNHTHFRLIQNSKYWNCYTIDLSLLHDSDQWRLGGHQLDMTLFFNAYNADHAQEMSKYRQKCFNTRDIFSRACSFHRFCPNQIIRQSASQTAGIRIFLHQKDEYPMSSKDFIDIQTGRTSTITLNPFLQKFLSRSSKKCNEFKHETVEYISHFGVIDAHNEKYNKTEYDYVYEDKQSIIFNKCKCYSHRYPFSSSVRKKLCYYASPDKWIHPSDDTMRKIKCHDKAAVFAEIKTSELAQKHQDKIFCEQIRYRQMMQSLPWPKFEYIRNIWEDLFVPKIIHGVEFTERDKKSHHIYSHKIWREHSTLFGTTPFPTIPSRQEMILGGILYYGSRVCRDFLENRPSQRLFANLTVEELANLGYCIDLKTLSRSLAHVHITLPSPMMDVYEEAASFEWTETVSQIGGIFGLWIGVSLMVIVELMELFIMTIISFIKNKSMEHYVATIEVPVIEVPVSEVPVSEGPVSEGPVSVGSDTESKSELESFR